MNNTPLTSKIVERYHEDGFIRHDEPLLSPENVTAIYDELTPYIAGEATLPNGRVGTEKADQPVGPENPVRKIAGLSYFLPFFEQLAKSPIIVDKVEALLGPNIKLYTDEYFMKNPAREGTPFAPYTWHQDAVNYHFFNPFDGFITCWIALDDATIENGCMHMIPHSHTHGAVIPKARERFVTHPTTADPIAAEVKSGCAVFHHGLNFHCSYPNLSTKPRRAIAFHYMRSETRYLGADNAFTREIVEANRTTDPHRFMLVRGKEFPDCV